MKTQTEFRIGGMSCVNCRDRIEKTLKTLPGVEYARVDYAAGKASVGYDDTAVTAEAIKAAVEALDYRVLEEGPGEKPPVSGTRIAGTAVIIAALYMLMQHLGPGAVGAAFPLAGEGTSLAMIFIIGLVTSVHCIAMCGGINLSQTLGKTKESDIEEVEPQRRIRGFASRSSFILPFSPSSLRLLFPALLYNAGRVISYTAVGIIVGALGSVLTLSGRLQGLVQIAAGVFMVIMGINMLGVFPGLRRFSPRLPGFLAGKIDKQRAANKGPLVIGLLNGLMPCGPLQAMQLYALSTGSPLRGGLAMLLFSLGTVPLMFGLGALGSLLRGIRGRLFSRRVMYAGAVLITVMGLTMCSYGLNLSGLNLFNAADTLSAAIGTPAGQRAVEPEPFTPVIEDGFQIVKSTLSSGRYPAITVQQGIPVKWTIDAPPGSINGCNNRMIIREYGIEHRFQPGENLIEFTPVKTGRFTYSCWMGMIRSTITVAAEGEAPAAAVTALDPFPAGVDIAADTAALAELSGDGSYQIIRLRLRDEGMDPAILVMQRGLQAAWIVNNDSLDPGNSRLIFPAYYTMLDLDQGDNIIQLIPAGDFDFSTGDNVFYGYVKVVDDLSRVDEADIEAIKAEVSEFETLIYPEAYFEAASQSMGCCVNPGA